ncbi:hypothetical protein E4U17_004877 [Claviceps sp. LM77 group G4]|nr:hypothetical protein E4U17_004877 [Claviceps sp. LM77 group G4]KAG6068446.1 hypothetical protein E4U33_005049 [Claviceps sp. LM78 group G4]KAG6072531.1 hypothetical protein E4U16_005277 [Claviceps sp. LM84 group G4]
MGNKRTDISSFREPIQDLIREGYRHEDILSRVNTQLDAQNQRAISLSTLRRFIAKSLSLDKPDLDGIRELVQTLIHEGSRQNDILRRVNEQLNANNQRTISLRTLRRNIQDWGFNRNINQIHHDSLRELVQTRLANGDKPREILEHVNTQRSARHECPITLRTLQRRLKDWGLDRKTQHARVLRESGEEITELIAQEVPVATILRTMNKSIEEQGLPPISEHGLYPHLKSRGFQPQGRVRITDELVDCVRSRFFSYEPSDPSLLRDIQQCDNLPCSAYAIRKIRYQYGMKRRCRTEEERLSALQRGIEFIESDLQRSDAVLNFGRESLSRYVRQQGQIVVPRNSLYNFYREVFPEEVQRRSPRNFREPGPSS